MKFVPLSAFLYIIPLTRSSFLPKKTLCRDCKFFIANNKQCSRFGDINVVTGKETYDYASTARIDEKKCGDTAKYFEKNNYKMLTVPYYILKDYWPVLLIFGVSFYGISIVN
jgi:hypothetical protein